MVLLVAEILKEVARRIVAGDRVFGEATVDGPSQRRGKLGFYRFGFLNEDGGERLRDSLALESTFAGGQLIEDQTEGELVRLWSRHGPTGLFRAHIVDRAQNRPGCDLVHCHGVLGRSCSRRMEGKSEVQDFDPAFGRE